MTVCVTLFLLCKFLHIDIAFCVIYNFYTNKGCAVQKIFGAIQDLLEAKEKVIIAIEGRSASGKTQLATFIESKIDCNVFCMDDFCLTDEQRKEKERGFANLDVARFRHEVIGGLQKQTAFDYDKFNCKQNVYSKFVVTQQKPVNIIEGTYSCCNELRDYYDLKIFLKVDDVTQKIRLAEREPFENMQQWLSWEDDYFEKQNPEEVCDIICTSTLLFGND